MDSIRFCVFYKLSIKNCYLKNIHITEIDCTNSKYMNKFKCCHVYNIKDFEEWAMSCVVYITKKKSIRIILIHLFNFIPHKIYCHKRNLIYIVMHANGLSIVQVYTIINK